MSKLVPHLSALLATLALAGCGGNDTDGQLESIVVEVTGDEFNWYFRYPGPDGELGTDDDQRSVQDLYLPTNARVDLNLKSNDYVYTFALPDLELREIAVPGLDYQLRFSTRDEETLQLLGDQLCGFAHESLIGKVYVRDRGNDFYDW